MQKWVGPVVGGLALVLGVANLWALQGVSSRLDELAASQQAAVHERGEPEGRTRRSELVRERRGRGAEGVRVDRDRPGPSATPLAVDLDDPVVVEELTARLADQLEERELSEREVRHQTFMDEASEEVRRFGEERDWSERTTTDVIAEVKARMDAWHTMRQDMRDGGVSRFDARRELEALTEESDAKLLSLISEEDFEGLSESVLPGPGRGGRGGPPRR